MSRRVMMTGGGSGVELAAPIAAHFEELVG